MEAVFTNCMNKTDYATAWEAADKIDGWLTEYEASLLFHTACLVPDGCSIVEVGCYHGRSTVLMAHGGARIIAVDPLLPTEQDANRMAISPDDYSIFARNIAAYDNVVWFPSRLEECIPGMFPPNVDMVYIDANHQYPHPKTNFEYLAPLLKHGAQVVFHDYGTFPGVTQACNELESAGLIKLRADADSLRVYTYQTQP